MFIPELTMTEFLAGLKKTNTVLLPLGSTEEHGSHLPLDTDTIQALAVGRRLSASRPLFIAPPLHYGVCRSSGQHAGTLGIRCETLKALVIDVASALYRQGLRNIVLLSGHAGGTHMMTLTDAGETLLEQYDDLRIAVICEYQLVQRYAAHLIETADDAHAGEIETSRIMHSRPQLVNGLAAAEYPDFPEFILVRDKQACWPGGVWGDPGRASAAKGAEIERLVVAGLEQVINKLEQGG